MPRGKGHKVVLPRRDRYRNQDEMGQIFEANPGLYFFSQGESEFQKADFFGAIQDFSTALNMLELVSTSPPEVTVKALHRRAQCFFFLGQLDQSERDCTKALNISEAIGFQEGIFEAILLKISTIEVTGDIRRAFHLAVSLKTLDLKKATPHVGRLREILEQIFREDPTLADELGDDLIRTGTDLFTNNRFKEAAEYFTEVIRLVCKFNFVRDAYVYQAKCHVKLGEYEEARDLCTTVLKRFPDDDDGRLLLESINTIILERKKGAEGAKKKTSKRPSSSRVPEKLVAPEKKPVPNKKQRKKEEYQRMKEAEEMLKDFQGKIKKDQEKQEQKMEEESKELDGAKSLPMPSYDVKAGNATHHHNPPSFIPQMYMQNLP